MKFKLKKDGKVVGYLKINPSSRLGVLWQKLNDVWVETIDCPGLYFKFDTAHPFVCPDKNGKDVFIEDSVWFYWMGKKSKAKVVKKNLFYRLVSCKGGVRGLPRTLCTLDILHIELIEEEAEQVKVKK